jgi:hypothetical protein
MKLVRQHIILEFIENSDPIKDMGIGLYAPINFKTSEEFAEFMYNNLAAILRKPKIPYDIIYEDEFYINPKYFPILAGYIKTYVTVQGQPILNNEYELLHELLKKKGFKINI